MSHWLWRIVCWDRDRIDLAIGWLAWVSRRTRQARGEAGQLERPRLELRCGSTWDQWCGICYHFDRQWVAVDVHWQWSKISCGLRGYSCWVSCRCDEESSLRGPWQQDGICLLTGASSWPSSAGRRSRRNWGYDWSSIVGQAGTSSVAACERQRTTGIHYCQESKRNQYD
jgi:hypothetical protein